MRTFLFAAAKDQSRLRLALNAHVTLAFTAGSVINIKSGRQLELEQRSKGRRLWSADDMLPDPPWPTLVYKTVVFRPDRCDLAVAIGLTHDVSVDVCGYCESALPDVGKILILKPDSGSGAQSIVCGRNAFELADSATNAIRAANTNGAALTHLFVSAPNAFTFSFGQRQAALGRVRLYEFNFDVYRDRTYAAALTLPLNNASA